MSTLSAEAIPQQSQQPERDAVSIRSLRALCLRSVVQHDTDKIRQECQDSIIRIRKKMNSSYVDAVNLLISALCSFEQLKKRLFVYAYVRPLEEQLIDSIINLNHLVLGASLREKHSPQLNRIDEWNQTLHSAIMLLMQNLPLYQDSELYKRMTDFLTTLRLSYIIRNTGFFCYGISDSQLNEQLYDLKNCLHHPLSQEKLNDKLHELAQCCEQQLHWFQNVRGHVSIETRRNIAAWLQNHHLMLTTPIHALPVVTEETESTVSLVVADNKMKY